MPIIRSPFVIAGGGGTLPTLNAVTASRSGKTLTITNSSTNGNFVENFKIYDNGSLVATIPSSQTTFNLGTITGGSHSVAVKASATNFNDSADSTAITFVSYSVTNNLTNLTNSNTDISIMQNSHYNGTLVAATGYYLPDSITVTVGGEPAPFGYNENTGVVTMIMADITDDIVITAVAETTPRLSAPVITLTGSVVSWSAVSNATSYKIYADGVVVATTSSTNYDLSSLSLSRSEITVTAIDGANYRESLPSNVEIYGSAPVYGVSGLTASATALTRTDDAVGKTYSIDTTTGVLTSDFDSLFPWNEITVEEVSTNDPSNKAKMVKFPDMWFRVGTDSYGISDIAVSKTEGNTGDWYKVDSFYYACYGAKMYNASGTSILGSISGMTRTYNAGNTNYTRANHRTWAQNTGTGFFQLDLYHATVLRFLWLIEFAQKNDRLIASGKMVGVSGASAIVASGGTDFLNNYDAQSGYNTSTNQMRWHYIEDFVGNTYEFVDGYYYSGNLYATADPSKFGDNTTGKNQLSYGIVPYSSYTNYPVLMALGWDSNNPFLVFPTKVYNDSSYTTYFAVNHNCRTIPDFANGRVGRGYQNSASSSNGVFFYDRQSAGAAIAYFSLTGSRLLYKSTT